MEYGRVVEYNRTKDYLNMIQHSQRSLKLIKQSYIFEASYWLLRVEGMVKEARLISPEAKELLQLGRNEYKSAKMEFDMDNYVNAIQYARRAASLIDEAYSKEHSLRTIIGLAAGFGAITILARIAILRKRRGRR